MSLCLKVLLVVGRLGALADDGQAAFEQQVNFEGDAAGSTREVMEFLGCCFMITLRRVTNDPSGRAGLKQLAAGKLSREDAADLEFCRMVALCIDELTEAELGQFNEGKLLQLPQSYVDRSKETKARALVIDMPDPVWSELQVGATKFADVVKDGNAADSSKHVDPQTNAKEYSSYGWIALTIILGALGGLAILIMFKLNGMQNRQRKGKSKTDKKKKQR